MPETRLCQNILLIMVSRSGRIGLPLKMTMYENLQNRLLGIDRVARIDHGFYQLRLSFQAPTINGYDPAGWNALLFHVYAGNCKDSGDTSIAVFEMEYIEGMGLCGICLYFDRGYMGSLFIQYECCIRRCFSRHLRCLLWLLEENNRI